MTDVDSKILFENLERSIAMHGIDTTDHIGTFSHVITAELVEKYGTELFPENRIMRGPVDIFADDRPVCAVSRELKVEYSFEAVNPLNPEQTKLSEAEVISHVVDEIYAELCQEVKTIHEDGKVFCPYILVEGRLVIAPDTQQLKLHFWTRYGIDEA